MTVCLARRWVAAFFVLVAMSGPGWALDLPVEFVQGALVIGAILHGAVVVAGLLAPGPEQQGMAAQAQPAAQLQGQLGLQTQRAQGFGVDASKAPVF